MTNFAMDSGACQFGTIGVDDFEVFVGIVAVRLIAAMQQRGKCFEGREALIGNRSKDFHALCDLEGGVGGNVFGVVVEEGRDRSVVDVPH